MTEGDYQESFANKRAKQIERSRVSNEGQTREVQFQTKCGAVVTRRSVGIGNRWKHDNSEYNRHMDKAIELNCGCLVGVKK
jgi:hypothetical protein